MPLDHLVGFVDSIYGYRSDGRDDLLAHNDTEEPRELVMDDSNATARDCLERLPPAELAVNQSTVSARYSIFNGTTANEIEIIAGFLHSADLHVAEILGDMTAMTDAEAYRLARGQAHEGGEQ